MKPLLVILNPRRIPQAIEAFEALPISKLWVTGYSEANMPWPSIMELAKGRYSHMVVCSDDVVVTAAALGAVLDLLAYRPVVTGYCNLDIHSPYVNLTKGKLGPEPHPSAYHWYTLDEVELLPRPQATPTSFTGMCLTAMSTEMWECYPFGCYRPDRGGWASDHHLSIRLQTAGIPIVAPREGFVWHLKKVWNTTDPTLVGKIKPELRLDPDHGIGKASAW